MPEARNRRAGSMSGQRTIGLVAPSGPLADPTLVDRAAESLVRRGWRVVAGDGPFRRHQRFAGTDEERLAELEAFCTDPTLDVVLAVRGGYGMSRLLNRIDWPALRDGAPLIVGFSDFTAFNLALLARTGRTSFQGPTLADFAREDDFTASRFLDVIEAPRYRVDFAASPRRDLDVTGRLWGGNLAMVCSLVGTPFLPRIRGGILFLEDVNEAPYRVDRMLYQLLNAGILERQRAIVLGEFSPPAGQPPGDGFDFAAIVAQIGAAIATPVLGGLPFGHGPRRETLAVGARARLVCREGRAELAIDRYPSLA